MRTYRILAWKLALVLIFSFVLAVTGAPRVEAEELIVSEFSGQFSSGFLSAVIRVDSTTGGKTIISSWSNLKSPRGLTIDSAGNIIVVDAKAFSGGTGGVIRIDPISGAQTVVSTGGSFKDPVGITIDANGDYIVADVNSFGSPGNGAIIKVDPVSGTQTLISSGGYFVNPTGVVIDASGDILVADSNAVTAQGAILRVDPGTGAQTIISSGGNFQVPRGIAIEASGDLIIIDGDAFGGPGGVIRVDPISGAQTVLSSGGGFNNPTDVAIGASGDLFVMDADSNPSGLGGVWKVDPVSGAKSLISSGSPFHDPWGIEVVLALAPDGDGDGVADDDDNCPEDANGDQADSDLDGVGDVCDVCPNDANPDQTDPTSPVLSCPGDVTLSADADCGALVPDLASLASASDSCLIGGGITVSQSPAAGTTVGLGTTVVTITASDPAGNSSQCSVNVDVVDTTAPELISPGDQTVAPVDCASTVVFDPAIAIDNCDPDVSVICVPASVGTLGPGAHPVTCTATDASGNSSSTSFTVTVLEALQIVFEQPPLTDDNVRDDIETDGDGTNKFKVGRVIPVKAKILDCAGNDVTTSIASSVTVRIDVTEREDQGATSAIINDVPEDFVGVGDQESTMVLIGNHLQYNLNTDGFESGTLSDPARFFRIHLTVEHNTDPGIVVAEEDALLESK